MYLYVQIYFGQFKKVNSVDGFAWQVGECDTQQRAEQHLTETTGTLELVCGYRHETLY